MSEKDKAGDLANERVPHQHDGGKNRAMYLSLEKYSTGFFRAVSGDHIGERQ